MSRDTDFNPAEFDEPPPWERCMQRVECPHCGKFHGYCSEIGAEPVREHQKGTTMDMSKHYDTNAPSFKMRPFLNPPDIPEKGLKATIIGFREAKSATASSDFYLDVKTEKGEFTLGLDVGWVILRQLIEQLGKESDNWKGKQVRFTVAKGRFINLEETDSQRKSA